MNGEVEEFAVEVRVEEQVVTEYRTEGVPPARYYIDGEEVQEPAFFRGRNVAGYRIWAERVYLMPADEEDVVSGRLYVSEPNDRAGWTLRASKL